MYKILSSREYLYLQESRYNIVSDPASSKYFYNTNYVDDRLLSLKRAI